jgi:hypothetical protein
MATPAEALEEMFNAFPSWFLRIECDLCDKVVTINEAHAALTCAAGHSPKSRTSFAMTVAVGLPARAELLTGIEAVSSRPVRRIMLLGGR